MIKKFTKKPVVIKAIKWDGKNTEEIESFIGKKVKKQMSFDNKKVSILLIPTLESPHEANIGDYIIKGVKGEFYPCKPDIFEETYEEVKKS